MKPYPMVWKFCGARGCMTLIPPGSGDFCGKHPSEARAPNWDESVANLKQRIIKAREEREARGIKSWERVDHE